VRRGEPPLARQAKTQHRHAICNHLAARKNFVESHADQKTEAAGLVPLTTAFGKRPDLWRPGWAWCGLSRAPLSPNPQDDLAALARGRAPASISSAARAPASE